MRDQKLLLRSALSLPDLFVQHYLISDDLAADRSQIYLIGIVEADSGYGVINVKVMMTR
jgi:hypothetical protein